MNNKCRTIELYAIKWEFDRSNINQKDFDKLEDAIVEEDEGHDNSNHTQKGRANNYNSNKTLGDKSGAKTACCSLF